MAARPPSNLPDLRGLTLLIVEDDPDSLEVVSAFLAACGARVLQTRRPRAAIGYIETEPKIDVVISDLKMPEMDGVRMLEEIRRRRFVPAVAMTGFYEEFEPAEARGFDAFIKKPVNLDQLALTVRTLAGAAGTKDT